MCDVIEIIGMWVAGIIAGLAIGNIVRLLVRSVLVKWDGLGEQMRGYENEYE